MRSTIRGVATPLLISVVLATCGGTAPPSTPIPGTTPVASATPDPHLTEPASVDDVIRKLAVAGLRITPNNATAGRDGEPVKSVNATFEGWPLSISQFSSGEALRTMGRFDPEQGPAGGDATYVLAGLNILIEYGPDIHTKSDPPPETRYRTSAMRLVEYLHPLLGPLEQVTLDPLPLPGDTASSGTTAKASPTP